MIENRDREVPKSIEAEQALIGTVLMSSAAQELAQWIRADDFHEQVHIVIWEAIEACVAEGRSPTPISVRGHLPNTDLGGVTVQQYLANLAAAALPATATSDLAATVRRFSAQRRLLSIALDLTEAGYHAPIGSKPAEMAASAIDALDGIVLDGGGALFRASLGRAAEMAADGAQQAAEGRKAPGILTGLKALDDIIGPMQAGNSIVIGGRPGMGKTAIALQIAINVARAGHGVGFFSLEMGQEELGQRAISMECFWQTDENGALRPAVPYRNIRSGRESVRGIGQALSLPTLERIWDAQSVLKSLPFEIDSSGEITLSQIATRARRMKSKFEARGTPMGLLVIDYLSLIKALHRDASREREVAEMSRGIKQLAKALGIPIITLAQLNRKIEERKIDERRPQISDFRESGSIEQDADILIGLFRKEYYLQLEGAEWEELQKVKNHLEAIVLKARHSDRNRALLRTYIGSNVVTDSVEETAALVDGDLIY